MDKTRSMAVQVTKEIIVKFIELGRISPTNFSDYFAPIYQEVLHTIEAGEKRSPGRGARIFHLRHRRRGQLDRVLSTRTCSRGTR